MAFGRSSRGSPGSGPIVMILGADAARVFMANSAVMTERTLRSHIADTAPKYKDSSVTYFGEFVAQTPWGANRTRPIGLITLRHLTRARRSEQAESYARSKPHAKVRRKLRPQRRA